MKSLFYLSLVAAGMFAVGAAWGFRTVEELEQSGARRIVHRPAEILELLEDVANTRIIRR